MSSKGKSAHRTKAKRAGGHKTQDWAPRFIGAIMEGMSVTDATAEAGVHITMPYKRRTTDEAFRRAWKEAADIGTELMEQEAARRAVHGTIKPVFHQGVECGKVREYSDTLMIFLLKARDPGKYREGVEGGRSGSFVININVVQVESGKPQALFAHEELKAIEMQSNGTGSQQDGRGVQEAAAIP